MRINSQYVNNIVGFSFIELITVVALMAIVSSAAAPVASSLFQRHREMVLRENLLTLRKAIATFNNNRFDDDSDRNIDEDSRGDENHDGFPGIRNIDDDGDLDTDEDWNRRSPFSPQGGVNPDYDWSLRQDDDEDSVRDEEAFASDLNDLTMKMAILHRKIPKDPTLRVASWDAVFLKAPFIINGEARANNDNDWFWDSSGNGLLDKGAESIILSKNNTFEAALDKVVCNDGGVPGDGTLLLPLVDEDPRNKIDDDGDGKIDEDPADLIDVKSYNWHRGMNQTSYCDW